MSELTDDSCGCVWNLSVLCLVLSWQETLGSLFRRYSGLRDPGLLPFPEGHLEPRTSSKSVCVQALSFMDWVSPCLTWEEEKLCCWKVGFTQDWKHSSRSPKEPGSQSDYLSWAESEALCDRKLGRLSNRLIRPRFENVHSFKQVGVCAVLFFSVHWLISGAGVFWFAWLLLRGDTFGEVWSSACIASVHSRTWVPSMGLSVQEWAASVL